MVVLEIRFPAGRFHATPWGRHVNEGVVEWPISPWRFLRALVAVACRMRIPIESDHLVSLVGKLSSTNPSFQLPKANAAHTRHYMPLYRSAFDGKTSKVFDTFVAVEKHDSMKMIWPDITLSSVQYELLKKLSEGLAYLGRAESWVDISLADHWEGTFNAYPLPDDAQPSDEQELIRLACPSPDGYQELMEELKECRAAGGRNNKLLPENFFSALCAETGVLQKQGWRQPPGLKWVDYVRPRYCFSPDYHHHRPASVFPNVARFAVISNVPPLTTNSIHIGERIREALLKWSDSEPVFLGRNENGPSSDPEHSHAFFLPEDTNRDGYIDHITVYADMGFNRQAVSALTRIEKLWGRGGHDLYLALIGIGQVHDLAGTYPESAPLLSTGTIWRTVTPYVPSGHLKIKQSDRRDSYKLCNALLREVNRELGRRNRPLAYDLILVEPMEIPGRKLSWLQFRSERFTGGGQRGDNGSFGIQLAFDEPVSGPLCIGYACHYGLGMLVPSRKIS